MPKTAKRPSRPRSRKAVRKAAGKGAAGKRGRTGRRPDTISRSILAREVNRQLKRFGLNREVAAVALDDAATQMSRLASGHYEEFSADRLMRYLLRLGSNVTISISHSRRLGARGRLRFKLT
jgi:hypothetical protein